MVSLKKEADLRGWTTGDYARFELTEFTLISLIPFIGGLAIAFVDRQGEWLQYYPFRFGDVMLPLTTCLLVACNMESKFSVQKKKFRPLLIAVLIGILFTQVTVFTQQAIASQEFPSERQDVNPQWKSMSDWIHEHTPKDAIIISHPWKLASFTWTSERATIVKLKMFPQTKKSIVEYYERLNDLSDGALAKIYFGDDEFERIKTVKAISEGFSHLSTDRVTKLMEKYHASYFLTEVEHHLDLEIVHSQAPYVLYARPKS